MLLNRQKSSVKSKQGSNNAHNNDDDDNSSNNDRKRRKGRGRKKEMSNKIFQRKDKNVNIISRKYELLSLYIFWRLSSHPCLW